MNNLKILSKSFYSSQNSIELAKNLLGKYIVRENNNQVLIGKINEVEAYLTNDSASHSFRGITKRTKAMFQEAGTVYIYLSYGNHWCMNIASNKAGIGEGILVRGFEPVVGIEQMKRNRNIKDTNRLSNGPGKVTQALQIDASFYGHKIWNPPLYIAEAEGEVLIPELIKCSPRIGISKNREALLRFYL